MRRCEYCQKEFKEFNNKRFCSNKCRRTAWKERNIEKVNKWGKKYYSNNLSKCLEKDKKRADKIYFGGNRGLVLKRDNYECQECGMNNEQHILVFGKQLTIHHIDGRGRYSEVINNNINNLITLCLRCHGLKHGGK